MRKNILSSFLIISIALQGLAQTPLEGAYTIHHFPFQSGDTTLPELHLHYTTIGTLRKDAQGKALNAVIIMHGTTGNGHQFLSDRFARGLFGPG
jgi:homoserine O-acetyltransferase